MKEILKVDWSLSNIFLHYIKNGEDKFEPFRDSARGTLTLSQIRQMDKI